MDGEPAHRPDQHVVRVARPNPRREGRAPRKPEGKDQYHHGEQEVRHHKAGRQVLTDREPAEHSLCDHAERQRQ